MFGICMNLNNFFFFLGTGIKPERERERGRKRTKYSGALGAHLVRYWNEHSLRQLFSASFASPPWNRIFTPRPPPRRPLSSEYEIIRLPRFPEFLEYFQKNFLNLAPIFFPKKFPKNQEKSPKFRNRIFLSTTWISTNFHIFCDFFKKNLAPNFERFEISENGNAAVNWNFF